MLKQKIIPSNSRRVVFHELLHECGSAKSGNIILRSAGRIDTYFYRGCQNNYVAKLQSRSVALASSLWGTRLEASPREGSGVECCQW